MRHLLCAGAPTRPLQSVQLLCVPGFVPFQLLQSPDSEPGVGVWQGSPCTRCGSPGVSSTCPKDHPPPPRGSREGARRAPLPQDRPPRVPLGAPSLPLGPARTHPVWCPLPPPLPSRPGWRGRGGGGRGQTRPRPDPKPAGLTRPVGRVSGTFVSAGTKLKAEDTSVTRVSHPSSDRREEGGVVLGAAPALTPTGHSRASSPARHPRLFSPLCRRAGAVTSVQGSRA